MGWGNVVYRNHRKRCSGEHQNRGPLLTSSSSTRKPGDGRHAMRRPGFFNADVATSGLTQPSNGAERSAYARTKAKAKVSARTALPASSDRKKTDPKPLSMRPRPISAWAAPMSGQPGRCPGEPACRWIFCSTAIRRAKAPWPVPAISLRAKVVRNDAGGMALAFHEAYQIMKIETIMGMGEVRARWIAENAPQGKTHALGENTAACAAL